MHSRVDSDVDAATSAVEASAARQLVTTRLSRMLDGLLGVVLCAVVALNFASAASRYLAKRAILGADEVQVFAMVWLVFLGGAVVAARRAHLCMDVFTAGMPSRLAWWRGAIESLLTTVVCGTMSWVSLRFVMQIHDMNQLSDGAGVPMWIPHLAVFVGFAAMTLIFALALIGTLRRWNADPNALEGSRS